MIGKQIPGAGFLSMDKNSDTMKNDWKERKKKNQKRFVHRKIKRRKNEKFSFDPMEGKERKLDEKW